MPHNYKQHDIERIWGHIKKDDGDGCWEWQASLSSNGYGQTEIWAKGKRKTIRPHRFSYETFYNTIIPEGLFACHKCDNKLCCRPDHIFIGTGSDNMKDAVLKKRQNHSRKTHCINGHEFTEENTYFYKGPTGPRRVCKTCQKNFRKNYYHKIGKFKRRSRKKQ